MKFILVILFTIVSSDGKIKNFEMRIPQENRSECIESSKTFSFEFPLPLSKLITEAWCEPRLDNEKAKVDGITISN